MEEKKKIQNQTAEEIRKETTQKVLYYENRFDTLLSLCELPDSKIHLHLNNEYVDACLVSNNGLYLMAQRLLEDFCRVGRLAEIKILQLEKIEANPCACVVCFTDDTTHVRKEAVTPKK